MEGNHDMLISSPDPLGLSSENVGPPSPIKAPRPNTSPRKALSDASGNAQVQEFIINTPPSQKYTPQRSSKHKREEESPWRIRLTVQAERMDEQKAMELSRKGTSIQISERTTTTTIPLKGGDNSPPAIEKRGRGRPRKSLDSPIKKNGTPKPKNAGRRKALPEPIEESGPISPSKTSPSPKKGWRGQGKNTYKAATAELSEVIAAEMYPQTADIASIDHKGRQSSRPRSRARRKEITPMEKARSMNSARKHNEIESLSEASEQSEEDRTAISRMDGASNVASMRVMSHDTSSLDRSMLDVQEEVMRRTMICHGDR